ncbi:MAG: hypothetical protein IH988_01710 [Planctomycetes bacterium]|nr:hypothetical protein [Planctomycetota bacterium]
MLPRTFDEPTLRRNTALISGGGNDLIADRLAKSLRGFEGATDPEQCIDRHRLDMEIGRLGTMYRDIHALVQGVKPGLPMIVHGYAYARPAKRYYILLLD